MSKRSNRHFLVTAHLEDCDDETAYVIATDDDAAQVIMIDHIRKVMAEDGEDLSEVEVYVTMVAELSAPPIAISTSYGYYADQPQPINPQ